MSKPTRIRRRFYRRTKAAKEILADGFRDATGNYMSDFTGTAVWVSDRPLDTNEGAIGDTLLQIDPPLTRLQLEFYEAKEAGKPFREWVFLPYFLIGGASALFILNRGSCSLWHNRIHGGGVKFFEPSKCTVQTAKWT